MRWTLVALGMLAALIAGRGLARRNTWYLASDQFAFLTFADDLRHGRVLHDPAALEALGVRPPGPGEAADAYYQTYLWRDGRLFSRYPPGFPLLLAAAGLLGGEAAEHWLNPLCYLVLLAVLGLLAFRLLRARDAQLAAGAGVAAAWALLVIPTEVHYWGITIARDLPAHTLGLVAVLAAWERRLALAGVVLGFACAIRPDAVLYGLGVGALALAPGARPTARALLVVACGFLLGAAPLFAYNLLTLGHPLHFTQGMEFRNLLGALLEPPTALAAEPPGGARAVAGGAFKLANLPRTLPAHLAYVGGAFRSLLMLAGGAAAWGLLRQPRLAAALVPYALAATVFFSCWGHPDPRYLVGAALATLVLAAVGAALWATLLADAERPAWLRAGAVALTAIVPLVMSRVAPGNERVVAVELALGVALATVGLLALLPAGGRPARRLAVLAPALALAAVGIARVATGSGGRDPFQAAQAARARAAVEALVPPGALVITSASLGRPAENITHYTHAIAFYDGELRTLGTDAARAAAATHAAGRRVFLLLGAHQRLPLAAGLRARPLAQREGAALYDWFVDPGRARTGATLVEVVGAGEVP